MPHIITIRKPLDGRTDRMVIPFDTPPCVVATLEELEARLYNEVGGVHGESYEPLCATIEDLLLRLDSGEESGGTIGPLPDGTLIEVKFASWQQLGALMGTAQAVIDNLLDDNCHGEIIDAYNAQAS